MLYSKLFISFQILGSTTLDSSPPEMMADLVTIIFLEKKASIKSKSRLKSLASMTLHDSLEYFLIIPSTNIKLLLIVFAKDKTWLRLRDSCSNEQTLFLLNIKFVNVLVYVTSEPPAYYSFTCSDSGRHYFLHPLFYEFLPPGPILPSLFMRKLTVSILSPSFPKPHWPFLADFDWRHLEGLDDPSIHQSLTYNFQRKQEQF